MIESLADAASAWALVGLCAVFAWHMVTQVREDKERLRLYLDVLQKSKALNEDD